MTRALILCAGKASRWNNFLGVPKQLAPVHGETILDRCVRLLREQGIQDIHIVTHDERFRVAGCGVFPPRCCEMTMDSFLSTKALWAERTLVLLGDVWFSEAAMQRIVSSPGRIALFGRPNFSRYTGCARPEMFGFAFAGAAADEVRRSAEAARHYRGYGATPGKLWSFYYCITGPRLRMWLTEREIFQVIDDFTNDFDSAMDYRWWTRRYQSATGPTVRRWLFWTWVALQTPVYRLTIPRRKLHPLWLLVDTILRCQDWFRRRRLTITGLKSSPRAP
jgi:hypothetical protein